MNAAQLRAAATRARAARQTVHLLPGDAEALADELDRLQATAAAVADIQAGIAEAEALADELVAGAPDGLWMAQEAIRHAGAGALTCPCDDCDAAIRAAMEGQR